MVFSLNKFKGQWATWEACQARCSSILSNLTTECTRTCRVCQTNSSILWVCRTTKEEVILINMGKASILFKAMVIIHKDTEDSLICKISLLEIWETWISRSTIVKALRITITTAKTRSTTEWGKGWVTSVNKTPTTCKTTRVQWLQYNFPRVNS